MRGWWRSKVRALRKFAHSTAIEQRLVAKALVIVPLIRIALWLVPFRFVHRATGALLRRGRGSSSLRVERIVWAVTAVTRRVPSATCLTQALAAAVLLPRYGHEATLRVGVAKREGGRLHAHAWVESGGAAVLGEPAPGEFRALPPLVLS
jgi:hypothetical protein